MRRASRCDRAKAYSSSEHRAPTIRARGAWASLFTAVLVVGCAAQEEVAPNGGGVAGTSSGTNGGRAGSGGGGSSSGTGTGAAPTSGAAAGGSANAGTTSGGNSGASNAGAAGAGATSGGGGGASGAAGAGGRSGAAGAAGTAGASGAAGASGGSAPLDACDNGEKDGAETDVDCGGNSCAARCATNEGCALVTDCQNDAAVNGAHHVCDAAKCRARGCNGANCAYDLTRFIIGGATPASARGQVFVTWTAAALSLDFQIHDVTPKDDSPDNWKDDSVEIYLDLNHAKSLTFDGDDFQVNVPRVGTPQAIGAVDTAAITVTRTDDGQDYRLRVTLPWSALNNAGSQVGKTLGFSLGLNDDANADPERDTQVMLYGTADNYMNASQFGDLQLN